MQDVVDAPEAGAEAERFGVPPFIHAEDFIFHYHLEKQPDADRAAARARVVEYYFRDGDHSARQLDDLLRPLLPADTPRVSLLEFASGYGCVSRHLARLRDRYDLTACDIHPQAISFLQQRLGVPAILSRSSPADFTTERAFDVVFALSFFSHMPDSTFGDWIAALFARVADGGLLIFTAHGRQTLADLGHPPVHPDGYWFSPYSEQKDIPGEQYGGMVASPFYVIDRIARCEGAALVQFRESFWWGKQDLYIVRKASPDFRPQRG